MTESPGGFLLLAPFEQGLSSQPIRASPALGHSTNLVFQCRNLVSVPARTGLHSVSALCISALKDGLSEDNRE